jgi:signal recognition particle receptor subunit beta
MFPLVVARVLRRQNTCVLALKQAELFNLLDHEHLQEAAILVMANKQDLKDAMTVKEMTEVLSLHSIKRHDWHIQVSPTTSPPPPYRPPPPRAGGGGRVC